LGKTVKNPKLKNMRMNKLNIGIVGAGVGGLSAAIALRQFGHKTTIFEKTKTFARVGADINLTPNAVGALDKFGIGDTLRQYAARPSHRISRTWDTGEETSRLEMSDTAEHKYGAPQLTIHRADLLKALENKLPADCFRMGYQADDVTQNSNTVTVSFIDHSPKEFDLVLGADGIHSLIRTKIFGPDNPEFTGLVSYRSTFSLDRASSLRDPGAFTKWWGPEPSRQIVTFPLSPPQSLDPEIFVFATTPQDDWREESWTSPGDIKELREAYSDFHKDARALLEACETVTKSALYVRNPMATWSKGCITLVGDAAHPMTPFMAQGACQAIEDGVILARTLEKASKENIPGALLQYENARMERTAKIQILSRGNEWLKKGGNADWLYAYDAWKAPI
jgi:salicylate hydroxylase